ncbi:aldo/keto reductase, partial [Streptomyces acidicola]|uniref:aldo/keto reductase n=1 Tax=Streptomyces acidicola TaxID=2596892 RepID=UPI002240514F
MSDAPADKGLSPAQIARQIDASLPRLRTDYVDLYQAHRFDLRTDRGHHRGLCSANGISQIVWSPLAQGILTGKYKPGQPVPEGSRFASEEMSVSKDLLYSDAALEAVQRLVPIAEEAG